MKLKKINRTRIEINIVYFFCYLKLSTLNLPNIAIEKKVIGLCLSFLGWEFFSLLGVGSWVQTAELAWFFFLDIVRTGILFSPLD